MSQFPEEMQHGWLARLGQRKCVPSSIQFSECVFEKVKKIFRVFSPAVHHPHTAYRHPASAHTGRDGPGLPDRHLAGLGFICGRPDSEIQLYQQL